MTSDKIGKRKAKQLAHGWVIINPKGKIYSGTFTKRIKKGSQASYATWAKLTCSTKKIDWKEYIPNMLAKGWKCVPCNIVPLKFRKASNDKR